MSTNINISSKNVVGKCDLKCSYAFKYTESTSTAKNNGVMISLSYESRSVPSVSYNNEKYNVSRIVIVSPSIHNFNGKSMPGEILIEHSPVKGGPNLSVCIPFKISSEATAAGSIITQIINKVSSSAPAEGDSTSLNIQGFNLQTIVPKKPFYSYTTTAMNYIVYGDLEAIPLSQTTITTLQQIIKPFPISTQGGELFYNSKGPVSGLKIGDGLYISCQPTGSSTSQTEVEYSKNTSSYDYSSIVNSPYFNYIVIIIICIVLFIMIFYGVNAFFKYLNLDSSGIV